jgi:hypothetical protein
MPRRPNPSGDVLFIPAMAARIMEALSIYRFLSVDQMVRLGIGAKTNIYKAINHNLLPQEFVDASLIGSERDETNSQLAKPLPRMFFLTRTGADAYERATSLPPGSIQYPHRPAFNANTQLHRLRLIDCHITIKEWADKNIHIIDFFHLDYSTDVGTDFDTKSPLPPRLTKLLTTQGKPLQPDAIFQLTDPRDMTSRLYIFELYIGRKNATNYFVPQLNRHCFAISEDAVKRTFGYEHGERVLVVFNDPGAVDITKAAMLRTGAFTEFGEHFFLKSYDELTADFRTGWKRLDPTLPNELFQ